MKRSSSNNTYSLPKGISLQVYEIDKIVFESREKWLYPLLELKNYLDSRNLDTSKLFLSARVAGRAAAYLIAGMGFKSCYIQTLSSGALDVFKQYNINCSWEFLVKKIDCMTEDLIKKEISPDQVYEVIKKRAGRIKGMDLKVKNLRASYPGKLVLSNISINIKGGDKIIITGENGAGKSTFLKILAGIHKLYNGIILLAGKDIKQYRRIPSPIAYVNQDLIQNNFPIKSSEIVLSATLGKFKSKKEAGQKVEIAMRRTGCFHLKDRNFNSLSGGEKQRVSIARCLCQEASLMLLDEPTSFLDSKTKDEVLEILDKIMERDMTSIIIASHDHEWIKKINWQVQELKDGKLCLKY